MLSRGLQKTRLKSAGCSQQNYPEHPKEPGGSGTIPAAEGGVQNPGTLAFVSVSPRQLYNTTTSALVENVVVETTSFCLQSSCSTSRAHSPFRRRGSLSESSDKRISPAYFKKTAGFDDPTAYILQRTLD